MRTPGYSEVKRAQTSKLSDLDSCAIAFASRFKRCQERIAGLSIVFAVIILHTRSLLGEENIKKHEIWMAVSSKIVRVGEILALGRASHIGSSVLSLYLNCTVVSSKVRYGKVLSLPLVLYCCTRT